MKCIICHGTDIVQKRVNEEYYADSDIIYVPVDVLVCATCGERYYDRKTKRYLDGIEARLSRKDLKLTEIGKVKILAA